MNANGYEVSLWDGEKVLELGIDDGCRALWTHQKLLDFRRMNCICEIHLNKAIIYKQNCLQMLPNILKAGVEGRRWWRQP